MAAWTGACLPGWLLQVLVVSKAFVPQSGLLSAEDLGALATIVTQTPAVGFFNSGPEAGAR